MNHATIKGGAREAEIRVRAEEGRYGYESDVRADTLFLLAVIERLREEVAEYVTAFGTMDFVARGKLARAAAREDA